MGMCECKCGLFIFKMFLIGFNYNFDCKFIFFVNNNHMKLKRNGGEDVRHVQILSDNNENQIHTKRRNRLTKSRLNNLVFIEYNKRFKFKFLKEK